MYVEKEAYLIGGYGYDSGSNVLLDTMDIFAFDTETWRTASGTFLIEPFTASC